MHDSSRFHHLLVLVPVIAGVLCAFPTPAHAYRPFDGTDADVAEEGEFELEIGPSYTRGPDLKRLALPQTVLNLGIFPRVELVVDGTNVVDHTLHVDGTDVMVKGLLRKGSLQSESGPSLAIEAGPLLPTSDTRRFGAESNFIASQRWSAFTFHLDNALEMTRESTLEIFSGLIVEGPSTSFRLRPVAEVFATHELGGDTSFSMLGGAIWKAGDEISLDAGMRAALVDHAVITEARLGLTWAIPFWTPRSAPAVTVGAAGR